MYSEDLDLCYQARRAGFDNYHVGRATIVHYGGRSSSSVPKWQTVMKTEAEIQFCEKNYSRLYALMFRMALGVNAVARLTLLAAALLFRKQSQGEAGLARAWARWSAILETALHCCTLSAAPLAKDDRL